MDASFEFPIDWARSAVDSFAQRDLKDITGPSSAKGVLINGVNGDTSYKSLQLS